MLSRDKDKQELISREKKDRCDIDRIAALASRMGLYRYEKFVLSLVRIAKWLVTLESLIDNILGSHLYSKVVVVSKVPLPNYRFDLDDRRPQREVFSLIPISTICSI